MPLKGDYIGPPEEPSLLQRGVKFATTPLVPESAREGIARAIEGEAANRPGLLNRLRSFTAGAVGGVSGEGGALSLTSPAEIGLPILGRLRGLARGVKAAPQLTGEIVPLAESLGARVVSPSRLRPSVASETRVRPQFPPRELGPRELPSAVEQFAPNLPAELVAPGFEAETNAIRQALEANRLASFRGIDPRAALEAQRESAALSNAARRTLTPRLSADPQAAAFRARRAGGVAGFSGLPELSESELARISANIRRVRGQ